MRNLNPQQFGETYGTPFHDPDEGFTYQPDKARPRSVRAERLEPFNPYEDSEVDPMTRRAN